MTMIILLVHLGSSTIDYAFSLSFKEAYIYLLSTLLSIRPLTKKDREPERGMEIDQGVDIRIETGDLGSSLAGDVDH